MAKPPLGWQTKQAHRPQDRLFGFESAPRVRLDEAAPPAQGGVYGLQIGRHGELVYIGFARSRALRLARHRRRLQRRTGIPMERVYVRWVAEIAPDWLSTIETVLIQTYRPAWNRASGFSTNTEECPWAWQHPKLR